MRCTGISVPPPDRQPGVDTGSVEAGPDEGSERARRAFDHAVERERAAIATHERAATMHAEAAALLEQAALTANEADHLDELIRRAEAERKPAEAAADRAATARHRLRSEGVPVDE